MASMEYDLLIRAGRVFCAETGLDGPGSVAIAGDRIVASGPDVSGSAGETLDFPDGLALPGLVDMHAHPAPGDWKYGIDPDVHILPRGSTTILSQGDSGAAEWPEYRRGIIDGSRTRVRSAISPALHGDSTQAPPYADLSDMDVDACVAAIEDGDDIWGVSVNVSVVCCGDTDPKEVMRRTLAVAEATARPILFGIRRDPFDWPLADQLELLRPGDVLTYCFNGQNPSIVEGGRVVEAAWEARKRGVLFDVGHGMVSMDFGVAEAAIADGFLPDTISTDIYKRHVGLSPTHDLPRTISKFMASGMPENAAFERVTAAPARVLGLEGEVGTLATGACADVAVLRWNEDAAPLVDSSGQTRPGGCWEPVLTVRGGEIIGG